MTTRSVALGEAAGERVVLELAGEPQRLGQVDPGGAELAGWRVGRAGARTAESHRKRIKGKLHIPATAGLVRYAIRRGLIEA